ncbi:MAG: cell division protein ZapA [Acetobacteraceae bacterium]|nr:cell division protein ZapA [Acetobacteraceae bacterium]MBV8523834.1 cell division protein ZapA [Acetobacteraceae bacterium]
MALLTVRLNGYPHTVGCEDGQEMHLQAMAAEVDARIDKVKAVVGQSGEARLLALTALTMADELHDLRAELNQTRAQLARAEIAQARVKTARADPEIANRLLALANRAEEIAAGLEHN